MAVRQEAFEQQPTRDNSAGKSIGLPQRLGPEGAKFIESSGIGVFADRYTQPETLLFSTDRVIEGRMGQAQAGIVTLVIGADRNGIGGSAAREAIAWGGKVAISSRMHEDNSGALEFEEELKDLGHGDALWIPSDITNPEDRTRVIAQTVERFGRIDNLVIATGSLHDNFFLRMDPATEEQDWKVNYWGPRYLIKEALTQMRKQDLPKPEVKHNILGVSSVAGAVAPLQYEYGPAKAAFDNLIQSLPLDPVIAKGNAVRFNNVAPGFAEGTKLVGHMKQSDIDSVNGATTATRSLRPQEVGELIAFLTSPLSESNGNIVPIVGKGEMPQVDHRGLIIRV